MEKGKPEMLPPPPPPPVVPPNFVPQKVAIGKRVPMARPGVATRGQSISLLVNHFKVNVAKSEGYFYHYSVSIKYEDGNSVDAKGIGRKILDKLYETYVVELEGKRFAYDGEKSLFTIGPLPQNKLEFTVILDEVSSNRSTGRGSPEADGSPDDLARKRLRKQPRSKTYNVAISYAAKIPMQAIANALRGQDSEHFQEAVRVLDIILRQNAAQQGCLLVRQSFFHNDDRNYVDLGGGVFGCRGFHSSFRATQGGLSLNMDVSTTMIVRPGPVIDFLLFNQKIDHPSQIDWVKAKRTLKNLRLRATNSNREYKISGLSDFICKEQTFSLKQRSEAREVEITVYDYFVNERNIQLKYSGEMPCLNVGKPKRPTYIPVELCSLVSLQRYTKALSNFQRAALVEKSRQKPHERMNALKNGLSKSNYAAEPLLQSAGVTVSTEFTRIQGRVLAPPKLRVGNGEDFVPRNGRWNFNQKKLVEPVKIERWAVVNFSARCNMQNLCKDLIRCGNMKGIVIHDPYVMIEEMAQSRRSPSPIRVDDMISLVKSKLPGPPQFLLCILPEKKNSDLYGPWKKRNLSELGVVTQCIAPARINDQYLTNVLLKINAKESLGGLNSILTTENAPPRPLPLVYSKPTIIIGMDVSHGSPGRDVPSVAAVVSSRKWPLISKYRAAVRTQLPRSEMIESLFKPISETEDAGIFRELLNDFYDSCGRRPEQIIIFRDGVSESQFNQVLNIELEQIIQSCKFRDEKWEPKFMLVVAQKNHHTKIFQANSPDNVPPGTVIDNGICHPRNNDFYMCAHAGMIGTTRPAHYHVLYDELGYSPDDFQEFVLSLSYVYQRSTTAISIVAPICYAHLAAAQMSQFLKFEDLSDKSSSHSGGGGPSVPELPVLNEKVRSSMFFC
ncbi:Protein argonaute 4A [Salvia divinorum]|uniref:Protein argonaute 4A n=1 Tax=Salvia divinorum TaxID=28513 RepID=A0ABD1H906_SALDI